MEEALVELGGDSGLSVAGTPNDVFIQLKHYNLHVLSLLQSPRKTSKSLPQMADFLRRTPPDALQPCLDFTLFPLMLLLDAAVLGRSQQKIGSVGRIGTNNALSTPHVISDNVAEGMLICLEEVLKKCHLVSVNQMVMVLKKLVSGAMLSPSEASEEFREGIIRCFRALLLRLHPCSVCSCTCKTAIGLPAFVIGSSLQDQLAVSCRFSSESDECLLVFLQSQDASPAVGHWLSLLLQTADIEAARGLRGSGKLRTEAFLALRVLVAKVGTADALAFFLPGVVSQFTKVMQVSKTMISGAVGNVESLDNAVRGLTEFLIVVLGDEKNLHSIDMSRYETTGPNKDKSTESILEALHHLPINQGESLTEKSIAQPLAATLLHYDLEDRNSSSHATKSLYVKRTKKWLENTSARVDKLLSATFPHLCVHPAKKVRKGLVDAIQGLILKCSYTLEGSKLMLLECLCVLVCDESLDVSLVAQEFLGSLFIMGEKYLTGNEISEVFSRFIEKLQRVALGSDESVALSCAQRLLAVMYYAGPQLVIDHLLSSPVTVARLLDVLTLSLSHNSVFAGYVKKLILANQNSAGYLNSVAELKAGIRLSSDDQTTDSSVSPVVSKISEFQDQDLQNPLGSVHKCYELPRMPPWFVRLGNRKLYQTLAGILRLVGLSIMADQRTTVSLSIITDILLNKFHKLISELRMREYSKETWNSWYTRSGSGQLLRQASTAACVLSEIIFGISDNSVDLFAMMFQKTPEVVQSFDGNVNSATCNFSWKSSLGKDAKMHVIDCVRSILHEYLSSEIWNLPTTQNSTTRDGDAEYISLYFFQDTATLHQVIIDGIGICSITLGNDFSTSGFLHATLYLLLEKLICSSYQVRSAADAVVQVLCTSSGHPTAGHLIVANADYIIDTLCRQLRHLDLNTHVPDVLTAILSYIGVAREILPLLEEPLRTVSMELEVLSRHQHPELTIPFLKAVGEISKASRNEASGMPHEAESFCTHIKSVLSEINIVSEKEVLCNADFGQQLEQWEKMLFKLNESRRYRLTVASIVGSCLIAAAPLLASVNVAATLVALSIVEDGIATLAKVEEAYRHEKEGKEAIERAIRLCTFHDLQDDLEPMDDDVDENRLLPAMNKIWPYLVHCAKSKSQLAVRRCLAVVSTVVQICGGDFFSRRFYVDGSHFWKLLTVSPFRRKPVPKEERPILLPYRRTSESPEQAMAEVSTIKLQSAALNMITEISRHRRSSAALEPILKKVSGLVVGIAFSGVTGLREAAINALLGLACMDSDLIWLLLADVYYSSKKDFPSPPLPDLPDISQILPPPPLCKDYLYILYGGERVDFDMDLSSVEIVFQKLQTEIFSE